MPYKPRNLGATALKRRKRQSDPMQAFDTLPPPLRNWLATATLPWSPNSVRRAYYRALTRTGDTGQALAALDAIQQRQIAKDARQIWGSEHPVASPPT